MEVLRSLIDNEIMLQRAEKLSLMAVDSDVEAKFNELKAPYTQEDSEQLAARKMSVDRSQGPTAARFERAEAVQQGDHVEDIDHRQGCDGFLQLQPFELQPGGAAGSLAQFW